MLIHYMDHNDGEMIVKVEEDTYRETLTNLDGRELAEWFSKAKEIINHDPKISEFDACEAFFSFTDVANGYTTAKSLLAELDDEGRGRRITSQL
jgi:hypothetical protein